MNSPTRRTFLGTTAAGLAAGVLASSAKASAAEQVRHAVIGTGSQGTGHAKRFDQFDDCTVVAVCDVDPARRENARAQLSAPDSAKAVNDFRTILDDPEIDSVSIATPDHWHTPVALHALQAGKHVYVEKPCSHNIHESAVLARAADRYGKCVQHGTQSRSSEGIRDAIAYLHEGNLGKVRVAKAINHQFRGPIGRAEVESPPEGVDYDLWLGPAPVRPFTRNRWHYNWHWFWDYGCGDIANDGIHQIDVARWGLGAGLPNAISGSGGQLFYDDDHETPDTQTIIYEYDDCNLIYEMRLWTKYTMEGHDNGVVFYADKGTMEIGRHGCHVTFIGEVRKKVGDGASLNANMRNFLDAVKADNPAKLHAPMREGTVSAALCHMGNIVTRVERRLAFDAETWSFPGDAEANALVRRTYRKGYELPEV